MKNHLASSRLAILFGAIALLALAPAAKAQIIFFDDFTEDYSAASANGYTFGTGPGGIPATTNTLTYAPAGAPTNTLAWAPIDTGYTTDYGSGILADVGYSAHPTTTNGSSMEAYIQDAYGSVGNNLATGISTPILTASDTAVNLVAGDSYTLSVDVGSRTDNGGPMSTLGIKLVAGSTVLDPSVGGYTEEVTLGELASNKFTNFSWTIPASALVGDSGALSLQFWNLGNENQVNFSNIVLTQNAPVDVPTVPEPSTWAILLGGLAMLIFVQRSRRKD